MRHLPRPSDDGELDPGKVFDVCTSLVKNAALKLRLKAARANVVKQSADYDRNAIAGCLHVIQQHADVGKVSGAEMRKVYTARMAQQKSPGRPLYDRIKLAPPNARCPLCGTGTVRSLDHYLPKGSFPSLAVTPNNLVPVCDWCQTEKGEYYAKHQEELLIHPYFDDLDGDIWLAANVVRNCPAAFEYFTSPPATWPMAQRKRVATHLRKLGLLRLFAANAGSRLTEIRGSLSTLHGKGGSAAVCEYLQSELASLEKANKNSWTTAMYRAAIQSEWFCSGGFERS